MKELCIQVCPRARLDMAKHIKEFKDCDSCSWNGQNITYGTSICEIVEERCSREGRII